MATRKCPMCKGKGGYESTPTLFNSFNAYTKCSDCEGTGKQHQEKKWVAG